MKKLLSLLNISILATSVPIPLLANESLERVKRDFETTSKDVTSGFDLKIISKSNKWYRVDTNNLKNEFNEENIKWYILIYKKQIILKEKYNQKDKITISKFDTYEILKFGKRILQHFFSKPLEWLIYRWDGVGEPQTPIIDSNGNITNWNLKIKDSSLFQQGISFSLVDDSKTAKWSNDGMRLTVDGETTININNPNVEEVYWNGVKQNMLDHKVNINVKPETNEKNHKLVIKYNINGTKYTSEDIDVVMAAKIELPSPIVPEQLIQLINNTDLGNIDNINDDTIKNKIIEKNSLAIDFSQIKITNKSYTQATLSAIEGSKSYAGSVDVKYNFVPTTLVKLKINLTSSASGVQIDKDYLAQLDNSKMTNKVNTFYYANGKSVIKIKQPLTGNDIIGVVYGCDDKWNKTSQSTPIDPVSGLEIDAGQYDSNDGRYLIEVQHKVLPINNKNIYLQISEKQKMANYWNTDNGKRFEIWAEDNGYKNIRGYSENELNELFKLSNIWKQSLKHLNLKLDNFVVDNIKNVTQDEIDNYKTKMITSVKSQVGKYAPNVIENTDYVISVDNLVVGDWTTSKDVKVQAVDGSTKLLNFTAKTIPIQQKDQTISSSPNPEPITNNNKKRLDAWSIVGIVLGSLLGLFILGWLLKRFVVTPFMLEPIRKKKEKAFAAKTEKDIAQMKKDDEEWEAKQRGDK